MKLPKLFTIQIPDEKISDYLLSKVHKLGSLKAAYFNSYGFTLENRNEFVSAITDLINEFEIINQTENEYGMLYVVDGSIKSPSKKIITLRTIWIVEHHTIIARLVTVYPK